MSYEDCLTVARAELATARALIQDELRAYPTPVSGCDAQYNHLIGLRGSITDALRSLDAPRFVATPRTPEPFAGVESR
ncbi:hypothetical protein [Pseudaestuariivita atlantica]|uniref:Uncharacterized protein n=1 Tax=Pseudaestuariivita atlantica TaxID=1317121 RepID=A0A0L1JNB7_9RHOB|nr:hypothetical protein [Pseudaestuariivita atlantica]KNG93255.1 hypothetical protein ATO11_12425 [Pseudaestuariivita atlantica]